MNISLKDSSKIIDSVESIKAVEVCLTTDGVNCKPTINSGESFTTCQTIDKIKCITFDSCSGSSVYNALTGMASVTNIINEKIDNKIGTCIPSICENLSIIKTSVDSVANYVSNVGTINDTIGASTLFGKIYSGNQEIKDLISVAPICDTSGISEIKDLIGGASDLSGVSTLFGKIASIGGGCSGESLINFSPVTSLIGTSADCVGANNNCSSVLGKENSIIRSLGTDTNVLGNQVTVFDKFDEVLNGLSRITDSLDTSSIEDLIGTGCQTGDICSELNNIESLILSSNSTLSNVAKTSDLAILAKTSDTNAISNRIGFANDLNANAATGTVMGKLNNLIDFNSTAGGATFPTNQCLAKIFARVVGSMTFGIDPANGIPIIGIAQTPAQDQPTLYGYIASPFTDWNTMCA